MAKTKNKKVERLPLAIRNEIRMLCAIKGCNKLKSGKKKSLAMQYDAMYLFYHGKEPSRPSQIKLLCSGTNHCVTDGVFILDGQTTSCLTLKRTSKCSTSRSWKTCNGILRTTRLPLTVYFSKHLFRVVNSFLAF